MKILLLMPINRTYVIAPSLGLGYIASILKEKDHEVRILHCTKEGYDYNDFKIYLEKNGFDAMRNQMFTFDIPSVKKHLEFIDKIQPNAVVFVGGYHPSGDPKGILNMFPSVNFAFRSEVEIALPLFLEEILLQLAHIFLQLPILHLQFHIL